VRVRAVSKCCCHVCHVPIIAPPVPAGIGPGATSGATTPDVPRPGPRRSDAGVCPPTMNRCWTAGMTFAGKARRYQDGMSQAPNLRPM
jgi:hypothetical protein